MVHDTDRSQAIPMIRAMGESRFFGYDRLRIGWVRAIGSRLPYA